MTQQKITIFIIATNFPRKSLQILFFPAGLFWSETFASKISSSLFILSDQWFYQLRKEFSLFRINRKLLILCLRDRLQLLVLFRSRKTAFCFSTWKELPEFSWLPTGIPTPSLFPVAITLQNLAGGHWDTCTPYALLMSFSWAWKVFLLRRKCSLLLLCGSRLLLFAPPFNCSSGAKSKSLFCLYLTFAPT